MAWPDFPELERPRVLRTERSAVSPWVDLVEREIVFPGSRGSEVYHALGQVETVGILALDADGRIAVVRQFRPAIDQYVWELPAGMVDPGDNPEDCCRTELEEEVGLRALELVYLGAAWPDTGRLGYRHHAWAATVTEAVDGFTPEAGTQVAWVDVATLYQGIAEGRFPHQLHVAVALRAMLAGLIPPPAEAHSFGNAVGAPGGCARG